MRLRKFSSGHPARIGDEDICDPRPTLASEGGIIDIIDSSPGVYSLARADSNQVIDDLG